MYINKNIERYSYSEYTYLYSQVFLHFFNFFTEVKIFLKFCNQILMNWYWIFLFIYNKKQKIYIERNIKKHSFSEYTYLYSLVFCAFFSNSLQKLKFFWFFVIKFLSTDIGFFIYL